MALVEEGNIFGIREISFGAQEVNEEAGYSEPIIGHLIDSARRVVDEAESELEMVHAKFELKEKLSIVRDYLKQIRSYCERNF